MFEWLIGSRYLWNQTRRNDPITWIAIIAILGIALSTAAMTLSLNVVNGVYVALRDKMLGTSPHVIMDLQEQDPSPIIQLLQRDYPNVQILPFTRTNGVLRGTSNRPVFIDAIESHPNSHALLAQMKPFDIVIGNDLATALSASPGMKIQLLTDSLSMSPMGQMPRYKSVRVSHLLADTPTHKVYMRMSDINILWQQDRNHQWAIYFENPDQALVYPKALQPYQSLIDWKDWSTTWPDWTKARALEKRMTTIMLTMLTLTATFNILATLLMLVMQKSHDIAIMRTQGASSFQVMIVFMIPGMILGGLGLLLGMALGFVMTNYISELVSFGELCFGQNILDMSSVFGLSSIPTRIVWSDLLVVYGVTMVLSFTATLLPSWRASKIDPLDILRYE